MKSRLEEAREREIQRREEIAKQIKSPISHDAYLIARGVRDIGLHLVPTDDLEDAKAMAVEHDVKLEVLNISERYYDVLLYKDDYVKDILLFFKTVPGSNPLRHWGLGHLLGYGRHEISEFIKEDQMHRNEKKG